MKSAQQTPPQAINTAFHSGDRNPLKITPDDRRFTAANNPDKSVEEHWANWQKSRVRRSDTYQIPPVQTPAERWAIWQKSQPRRLDTIQITPVQAPAHLPLSRFKWGLICVIAVSGTLCLGAILLAVLSTYGHSIKSMWTSVTALF